MDIRVLDNGRLQLSLLSLSSEERAEVAERAQELTDIQLLHELAEPYWTNGSFTPFDAGDGNPFVGLTSAPCIAERLLGPDDNGKTEVDGRLWWFPDYAVRGFLDELIDKGTVEFDAAPEPQPTARRQAHP